MNNSEQSFFGSDRSPTDSMQPNYNRILLGFCRCQRTAETMATLAQTLIHLGIDIRLLCNETNAHATDRLPSNAVWVRPDARGLAADLGRWNPELIFLWSGATQIDIDVCRLATDRDVPVRFVELGWFPQSETVYFDYTGTNARSSIRELNLDTRSVDPRLDDWLRNYRSLKDAPRPDIDEDYVFVPLQDIRDVNITRAAPYQNMDHFVTALATRFPQQHFVVRPHPHYSDVWLEPHANISVRRDLSIHPWLQHATAVVGINSTALLEALCAGKPTHSVGIGISTGLDVMYEFDGVDAMTLHHEISSDRQERIRRFLSELIFTRQAYTADLSSPDRLPHIYGLTDLLSPQRCDTTTSVHPATISR